MILRIHTLESQSELRVILLPTDFLDTNSRNQSLQLVRKQISQILNYLKLNPSKRYEQINKLITKRHYLTNLLSELLLGESTNFVVNFVNQENQRNNGESVTLGRFEFFDKLNGIKNFVRNVKSCGNSHKICIKSIKSTVS